MTTMATTTIIAFTFARDCDPNRGLVPGNSIVVLVLVQQHPVLATPMTTRTTTLKPPRTKTRRPLALGDPPPANSWNRRGSGAAAGAVPLWRRRQLERIPPPAAGEVVNPPPITASLSRSLHNSHTWTATVVRCGVTVMTVTSRRIFGTMTTRNHRRSSLTMHPKNHHYHRQRRLVLPFILIHSSSSSSHPTSSNNNRSILLRTIGRELGIPLRRRRRQQQQRDILNHLISTTITTPTMPLISFNTSRRLRRTRTISRPLPLRFRRHGDLRLLLLLPMLPNLPAVAFETPMRDRDCTHRSVWPPLPLAAAAPPPPHSNNNNGNHHGRLRCRTNGATMTGTLRAPLERHRGTIWWVARAWEREPTKNEPKWRWRCGE